MTRHIILRVGSTVVNAIRDCTLISDPYWIRGYLFVTGLPYYHPLVASYRLASDIPQNTRIGCFLPRSKGALRWQDSSSVLKRLVMEHPSYGDS